MWEIQPHLQKGEKVVYEGAPNIMGYLWVFILAFLLVWTILIPAILIVWVIFERKSYKFVITNKRVATRRGILSEDFKSASFNHITSVRVFQGILGKIFGYGDVMVDTSGTGTALELHWRYVSDPIQVKNMIEKHVH